MSDKDNNNNEGVINFNERIQQVRPSNDEDLPDALEAGLETFEDSLEDAKGFVTITFDTEGQPSVIHAGELDLIKTVGTLRFVENELLNNVLGIAELTEEVDFEFDPDQE